jgi:hypothetical protein
VLLFPNRLGGLKGARNATGHRNGVRSCLLPFLLFLI